MRRLLPLALLLAGCVAPPEAPPSIPDAAAARETAVDLPRCDVVEAILAVPAERVRPHVPEAFDLAPRAGQALVVLGGFSCENGSRAFVAVQVVPRDPALRGEGIDRWFFEPEHDLDASPLRDLFESHRANITRVARVLAETEATGASLRVEAESWAHGVGVEPGALVRGQGAANEAMFREFAPADGGFVYFDARFLAGDAGSMAIVPGARVRTGAGTVAREILGESATGSAFLAKDYRLADAKIGFVPFP